MKVCCYFFFSLFAFSLLYDMYRFGIVWHVSEGFGLNWVYDGAVEVGMG